MLIVRGADMIATVIVIKLWSVAKSPKNGEFNINKFRGT